MSMGSASVLHSGLSYVGDLSSGKNSLDKEGCVFFAGFRVAAFDSKELEKLTCCLCGGVANNARQLICGDWGCQNCFDGYLLDQIKQAANQNTSADRIEWATHKVDCPSVKCSDSDCRFSYAGTDYNQYYPDFNAGKVIKGLQLIKCPTVLDKNKSSCSWSGTMTKVTSHLEDSHKIKLSSASYFHFLRSAHEAEVQKEEKAKREAAEKSLVGELAALSLNLDNQQLIGLQEAIVAGRLNNVSFTYPD